MVLFGMISCEVVAVRTRSVLFTGLTPKEEQKEEGRVKNEKDEEKKEDEKMSQQEVRLLWYESCEMSWRFIWMILNKVSLSMCCPLV